MRFWFSFGGWVFSTPSAALWQVTNSGCLERDKSVSLKSVNVCKHTFTDMGVLVPCFLNHGKAVCLWAEFETILRIIHLKVNMIFNFFSWLSSECWTFRFYSNHLPNFLLYGNNFYIEFSVVQELKLLREYLKHSMPLDRRLGADTEVTVLRLKDCKSLMAFIITECLDYFSHV